MVTTAPDGTKDITTPLTDADVESLRAGDRVRITGVLYTARDAAHGRLLPLIEKGEKLPFDPRGQIIYYTGDRKSTRLNSSHSQISYAVFCLKKKKRTQHIA